MKYKIEFEHKKSGTTFPEKGKDEEFIFEKGEFIPIPNVGDIVSYNFNKNMETFEVESRQFIFLKDMCVISVLISDVI